MSGFFCSLKQFFIELNVLKQAPKFRRKIKMLKNEGVEIEKGKIVNFDPILLKFKIK